MDFLPALRGTPMRVEVTPHVATDSCRPRTYEFLCVVLVDPFSRFRVEMTGEAVKHARVARELRGQVGGHSTYAVEPTSRSVLHSGTCLQPSEHLANRGQADLPFRALFHGCSSVLEASGWKQIVVADRMRSEAASAAAR